MVSHQYGRPNTAELLWQPRATGRGEAGDAVSDRNGDDAALVPRRSCRIPGLTCVWDVRASLGLCRSHLPLAFDLEKSSDVEGARRMAQPRRAHPTSKLALVAYLVRACYVCRTFSGILDGKRASRCSHVTLSTG